MKRLNVKVRRVYNKRKLAIAIGTSSPKKNAQGTFWVSVLRNDCNSWSEFYKYVKRQNGNAEIIPVIKDHNRTTITDISEKPNILTSYYASVYAAIVTSRK